MPPILAFIVSIIIKYARYWVIFLCSLYLVCAAGAYIIFNIKRSKNPTLLKMASAGTIACLVSLSLILGIFLFLGFLGFFYPVPGFSAGLSAL
jgi:hypothetical protein